jgi:ABC-type transport system involved in Fe-S cluster assembly fused permease/ATPase subunit
MPDGYKTQVGDLGGILSREKKQRILNARGHLKKMPKYIFLMNQRVV